MCTLIVYGRVRVYICLIPPSEKFFSVGRCMVYIVASNREVAGLCPTYSNNSGKVVHTHVPLFTKQYNLVPVQVVSSPHDSPFILVLCILRLCVSFPEWDSNLRPLGWQLLYTPPRHIVDCSRYSNNEIIRNMNQVNSG